MRFYHRFYHRFYRFYHTGLRGGLRGMLGGGVAGIMAIAVAVGLAARASSRSADMLQPHLLPSQEILAGQAVPAEGGIPGIQAEFQSDVPYVPTPEIVVRRMLELAAVDTDDVVYDLGSGDGRLVIAAVREFGARKGVGIEIQPELVEEARSRAVAAGVGDRVEFRREDLFEADFREASIVTLYLLPEINLRLRPILLQQLQPGTKIVSHGFDMGDWQPEQTVLVQTETRIHRIFVWTVPDRETN